MKVFICALDDGREEQFKQKQQQAREHLQISTEEKVPKTIPQKHTL